MSREAMQLALEALELYQSRMCVQMFDEAITALRQALEEKREPVGYFSVNDYGRWEENEGTYGEPLYTAPPKREWVGLTDEEVMVAAWKAGFDIHEDYDNDDDPEAMHWWSADGEVCDDSLLKLRDLIEAKLKEKNT